MKRIIKVLLVQVVFILIFVGKVRGETAQCGTSFSYVGIEPPTAFGDWCNCSHLEPTGNFNNVSIEYCCGWMVDSNCLGSDLTASTYRLCSQVEGNQERYDKCLDCLDSDGSEGSSGIWTAIGCISTDPEQVIALVVKVGLGLGGGIILISILIGAFKLSTSQGDPNKVKEAKEIITSAIIGLLFVIFSVTILQFIGVSILHIPGFGD